MKAISLSKRTVKDRLVGIFAAVSTSTMNWLGTKGRLVPFFTLESGTEARAEPAHKREDETAQRVMSCITDSTCQWDLG